MSELYTYGLTGTGISNLTANMDYTINGFSIKDTILEVINKQRGIDFYNNDEDELAQDITDALAIKLRLKQGE